ncbi:hypothetical protein BJX64DRAFT_292550 [Aspergillus heterothallicus]
MSAAATLEQRINAAIHNANSLQALIPEVKAEENAEDLLGHMMLQAARGAHTASYTLAATEYFALPSHQPGMHWDSRTLSHTVKAGHDTIAQDLLDRQLAHTDNVRTVYLDVMQTAVLANNTRFLKWILDTKPFTSYTLRLPIRRACEQGNKDALLLLLDRVRQFIGAAQRGLNPNEDLNDIALLLIGALEDPPKKYDPLMVVLLLPLYARCVPYLADADERAAHVQTMKEVRWMFEEVAFGRDTPDEPKFSTYTRKDCFHIMAKLSCDLPLLFTDGLSRYMRDTQRWPFDFVYRVDGVDFPLHRDVLSVWSDVFWLRFAEHGEWADRLSVTCDNYNIRSGPFQEVVTFMYRGRWDYIKHTEADMLAIRDLARQWGIRSLERLIDREFARQAQERKK